ncbi:Uncharacterised protein [Vibrio cholerae]|nr:Uncharacterised protein [Vibrio cholerae]
MWLSIKTRSNELSCNAVIACTPSITLWHSKPLLRIKASRIMMFVRLSSTISTRKPGYVLALVGFTSSVTGSVIANLTLTLKQEPCPTSLCTKTVPFINSAICLTIAKPKPVPPKRRVVCDSACSKGRKIRPNDSCAMPIPVSCTLMIK